MIPYVKAGAFAVDEVRRFSIEASATSGAGFKPADIVKVSLYRSTDSCTGPIIIDGARMTYD